MTAPSSPPWTATILTLFPSMFPGPLGQSLAGRALENGLWSLKTLDIRAYSAHTHGSVDDTPFGGGAGMVMRPDVIDAALAAAMVAHPGSRPIYLTPRGAPLTQARVEQLASSSGCAVLCGRYEGVDERVLEAWSTEEISVGDFVLSGGEPAALVMLDAVVRLLPGVVGNAHTLAEESFRTGLLEYPLYTRPADWNGHSVPAVLLSGHHGEVAAWRRTQAETATRDRRPDLWAAHVARAEG
jgi:tRNA (guanine37-N1)-methyltransferase